MVNCHKLYSDNPNENKEQFHANWPIKMIFNGKFQNVFIEYEIQIVNRIYLF